MRRYQLLFMSSACLSALSASPAIAQDAAPADTTPQKQQEAQKPRAPAAPTNANGQTAKSSGEIVITGSRVRHKNFVTAAPVDVITRDDTILAGTRTTAETLQNSTVTSGTGQITTSFLGFVSEGGSAANTVGLRGFGSARTLVLLNGRRLAPAGVGPQLVSADLNVLPTAMVQRIEILREGASSIYGSDAIAGVINIITDSSINGVTIDGFADHPLIGSGDTLRGSITAGKTFDRGHITGSFEYHKSSGLRLSDRSDLSCPRDLFFQNGQEIGQIDPTTGKLRCFPFQFDGLGIASGYGIFQNFTAGTAGRITFPGYTTGNPTIGPPVVVNNINLRPSPSPEQLFSHVISPVTTYTGYLNGSYDLDILGNAELYGEALFTRRQSHQDFATQLNTSGGLGPQAQLFGGAYYGTPLETYGYPVSPFFPTSWANAGVNSFSPFIVPDKLGFSKQRIDYFRGNVGLRGDLGIGNWRYDANFQGSRTRSMEDVQNPTTSRLTNALDAVAAPSGTPASVITMGLPGQTGAGIGYTCASNVSNGAYNGGNCVPLDIFDPRILLYGQIPDNVYNYIYVDNIDRTHFDQETAQLVLDGKLFSLQGGDVNAAVGFEHRHDYIRDVPSTAALAHDLYNRTSAGITQGSDVVNEAFGEVNVPFLKDLPFARLLELDASARYTHYRSYGSGFTYHLNAQWSPISVLRFRGNYGTSFRAPNLYEQNVASQTGFYPGTDDPCNGFGANVTPGSVVYQNCVAALTPILGANAPNFINTGSILVTTTGGGRSLKAEHSKAWGFGGVVVVPPRIADLTFAVDYWDINVKGEVQQLGNTLLDLCYDSADFPNNIYCSFIGPRATTGTNKGAITSFTNPYINVASQSASGIDFDVRYAQRLLGGRFIAQINATRNLHQRYQPFAGADNFDYNGTFGYPSIPGGPKWVGSADLRFITSNNITFRWGIKYIGRQSDNKLVTPFTFNGQPVQYDLVAEPYWQHDVSVQWQWPNIGQVTLGMRNLFNQKPPTISGFPTVFGQGYRIGNYFAGGDYDFYGRSLFVNVTKSFK